MCRAPLPRLVRRHRLRDPRELLLGPRLLRPWRLPARPQSPARLVHRPDLVGGDGLLLAQRGMPRGRRRSHRPSRPPRGADLRRGHDGRRGGAAGPDHRPVAALRRLRGDGHVVVLSQLNRSQQHAAALVRPPPGARDDAGPDRRERGRHGAGADPGRAGAAPRLPVRDDVREPGPARDRPPARLAGDPRAAYSGSGGHRARPRRRVRSAGRGDASSREPGRGTRSCAYRGSGR